MSLDGPRRYPEGSLDREQRDGKRNSHISLPEDTEHESRRRSDADNQENDHVLADRTDQEVVEVLSDDGTDSEHPQGSREYEDVEIMGVNDVSENDRFPSRIRHRRIRPLARHVRQRNDDTTSDDEIQIVDERPVLPLARFDDGDEFRRALAGRFGMLQSPIGTFEGDFGRVVSVVTGMNHWRRVPGRRQRPVPRRSLRTRLPVNYSMFEQFELPFLFEGHGGDEAETTAMERSIMERIERENDRDLDGKMHQENIYNTKQLKSKKDIAAHEVHGYTNDIKPDVPLVCELCAVPLGTGIPEEFKPNLKYDANLEHYSRLYRVQAPWFCCKQILLTDIELSKRVFVAKCGHVYCGRCIKNIGNRPRNKRANKKITIDNPGLSCPRRCPAVECGQEFRGKRTFTELYF